MAVKQLPDPVWSDAATFCVACGYSLEGLEAPGRCPECSAHFEKRQLVLCGVPNRRSGGSVWRRVAWGVMIAGGILLSQIWLLLLMWHWIILVVYIAAMIVGAAWLIITGPRERKGAERFVVSPGGIARVALRAETEGARLDSVFIEWTPGTILHIQRVSNVWVRVRIGTRPGNRGVPRGVAFDAGVRCPADSVPRVREWIESCIRGEGAAAREPVSRAFDEPPPLPRA